MRIVVLQHVPFEGPAAIAEWARERGHSLRVVHSYCGDALPSADDFELLVAMGGPMSVNDKNQCAWIEREETLLRASIAKNRSVLGVCLGAQLIASALGQKVYPGPEREIGWFPVRRVTDAGLGRFFPPTFTPLHWHGETFDLPPNATRLAETDVVPNQAFAIAERVLGLQFHFEATAESIEGLLTNCTDEITGGRLEQSPDLIREGLAQARKLRSVLFALLDQLAHPHASVAT